ncbi:hypothetical protein H8E88_12240 [candidate division KSB1 bacterium]|nr:hypothetical protein [candidate division KSB1 bacterium]
MDIISIIVALATIIAGIIAAIQLWEWWQKRKQTQKKKLTLTVSKQATKNIQQSIKIINFTHPLTQPVIQQIQDLIGQPISEIIEIKTQLDDNNSFDTQIDKLVDKVGFNSDEWQTGFFIVHIPGLAPAAVTLLAELHGRIGHFPTILRLRSKKDKQQQQYELAEIINLQNTRDNARTSR